MRIKVLAHVSYNSLPFVSTSGLAVESCERLAGDEPTGGQPGEAVERKL